MANFTKKNVQLTAAKIYLAPFDPETSIAENIPAMTLVDENDNVDAVINYLEANYSFERMAAFKNVVISDALEDEVVDEVDDCDIWEWNKTAQVTPSITGDWLTTLDLSAIKILLWFNVISIPGTEVIWEEQVVSSWSWAYLKHIRLWAQNHDVNGNIIAPTTIVVEGSVDNELTVDVDYFIQDNGFGEFGVVIIDSANVTTLAQSITITYNYTPIAASQTGYSIGQTIQPYMIVKVVGCPDPDGLFDTWYIIKASLSGSLDTNFVSTGEVPLSSITLTGGKRGRKLLTKTRI